ncbi:respiratory nitrate reductase subunit gamma [Actinomadura parmotrematis]|uniref:Respiratory nitrate reductase subunit gamma n=1 Tax=Actinomadura parmotrematis TaxID=2864039 RepID=A0ABS7FR35_9ACTN|nr:respiratory nitrate reductase subunit gamma [Actinomadura parmotrematis]MBW8482849.1 respiratory nitrate reductase subunit gamma [Actinomadura parmotrematis]
MNLLLWVALPYVAIACLVGGTVWRYRYDRFGWTTRSSELYEKRLLRIASPLFHFGLIFVILGHIAGLVVPEDWTEAVHVPESAYHAVSLVAGSIAGAAAVAGLALLVYRRRTSGPVFSATTRNDKLMYVLLGGSLLLGLGVTVIENGIRGPYDYRETVGPWFRDVFLLRPDPDLMARIPLLYKFHVLLGLVLTALFPFTRLIHAFAAPWRYPFRPYIVYRSRGGRGPATRDPARGWEPVTRR